MFHYQMSKVKLILSAVLPFKRARWSWSFLDYLSLWKEELYIKINENIQILKWKFMKWWFTAKQIVIENTCVRWIWMLICWRTCLVNVKHCQTLTLKWNHFCFKMRGHSICWNTVVKHCLIKEGGYLEV